MTSIHPDNAACAGCCGCEAHGFNKRTCDPNATENNQAISQPNPESNPNGGVFGPGCPELKGIGPGRMVGEALQFMISDL